MTLKEETFADGFVTYEAFGALGDGVADDLPAICAAHAYANDQRLPVRTEPAATYHLGRQALTAVITTDTDWTTSRFTIDDTQVDDHKAPLFVVRSLLAPVTLPITQLRRDQHQLAVQPAYDCHVLVESDANYLYIRRGLNQNAGVPQNDCFIVRRDGTIEGMIDWDYTTITRVEARPIDETPLVIRGGIFTTFANRMQQEQGYNYWARNIEITRSNTTIDGLTHYVVGETAVGHPYRGFLSAEQCANITLRNCFATGHKIYSTIGAAGLPVNMGSYDLHANHVVNLQLFHCQMHHLCDRTRWGVIATNFCKNIVLEDCTFSRMDTHMGVSGTYTIRRCVLGHMGLNAIGRGTLTVEDSTLYGNSLISFRGDYGSTWEGDLVIRNCRWIPACGDNHWPTLFNVRNDGMHDFGYPCFMPQTITVAGLWVDDTNHPANYAGLYLFTDPDDLHTGTAAVPLMAERPFPYAPCQQITVRGLTTTSGKGPLLSPNPAALAHTAVVIDPLATDKRL
ncbi:MAG: hypothetical protein KF832_28010 [Caldilineaceae bacterium]|nr:hypothetical protein [Caldilineaceae bacterium]